MTRAPAFRPFVLSGSVDVGVGVARGVDPELTRQADLCLPAAFVGARHVLGTNHERRVAGDIASRLGPACAGAVRDLVPGDEAHAARVVRVRRGVFLLDATSAALDAFARLPEGRYVNTKGATLFSKKPTRASVLEGAILDEKGAPAMSVVWTGADATVATGGACGDWLVKSGISGWTGRSDMATTWFKDMTMGCPTPASLYCVRTP